MSIHKSLATRSNLVRARNVLNRYERILQLRKTGKFGDEDSPFGLAKVRVLKAKKRGKEKKEKKEGEAAAPGTAPAAGAAAPAAPAASAGKAPAGKAPAAKKEK